MPCIALTSSINLHLLYAVTCMLSCQQISCENPGLISNTSWLLYFWTKGEWILSITGINISPAMLSLFMTQDTNTIPVPWIQRNHLPTRAWSLVSRGKKPPGRARLQTSMRMGKESLSRKYSSKLKLPSAQELIFPPMQKLTAMGSSTTVIGHHITLFSHRKDSPSKRAA